MNLNFWKPRKAGGGAAALFNIENGKAWLKMIPQDGTELRRFINEQGINVLLGTPDIGGMLAVISGRLEGLGEPTDKGFKGMYHQSPNSTVAKTLRLQNYVDPKKGTRGLSLSVTYVDGDVSIHKSILLTEGEIECLRVFLEEGLRATMLAAAEKRPGKDSDRKPETNSRERPTGRKPAKASVPVPSDDEDYDFDEEVPI